MVLIEVPDQYGYVVGVAVSTFFVNVLHVVKTGSLRYPAEVKAPARYASDEQIKAKPEALRFNCAQSAHANFTETHFPIVGSMLIGGLVLPVPAAILGGVWTLGRIMYLYGYVSKSGPQARGRGFMVSGLSGLGLMGTAAYAAFAFLS